MKDYIDRIMHTIVVEGKMSALEHMKSGVVQGTVLGMLLFLIYINNLPNAVKCNLGFFAYDSMVYNRTSKLKLSQLPTTSSNTNMKWMEIR